MSSQDECGVDPVSTSESQHSSPFTSPSTSECLTPFAFGFAFPKEASDIIADLSNFVPLGCLCFEDFTSNEHEDEKGQWREVTPLSVLGLSSILALLQSSGWIRVQSSRSFLAPSWIIYRISLLYSDVGLSCIRRDDSTSKLKNAVRLLLSELDVSSKTWEGLYLPGNETRFDQWATRDEEDPSLYYCFNKLPSPAPVAAAVSGKYEREALEDLLDTKCSTTGLATRLYPYQRRSAGIMLQREATSAFELDPRLEVRTSPTGSIYYYDCRKTDFQRDPQYYETCRGGILAETMGLGKTVICLALILATKNHLPKMPAQYALPTIRSSVGSLVQMASSAINLRSVPWEVELDRIKYHHGFEMTTCVELLRHNPPSYGIPQVPVKWCRTTKERPPHLMTLSPATLIVVPQNLCKQWQSEITKHVEPNTLRVLVMDDRKKPIPNAQELRSYDIILFSRNRFEMEAKHGADDQGRRPTNLICRCPYIGSSRKRDCNCLSDDDLYSSPLRDLHFKRIIVDEGHSFAHNSSNAASVAEKIITADHRWVVSGTPAKDLLGIEVDMSRTEVLDKPGRDILLEQRKKFSNLDKSGAIDSLGSLACHFLKVRPWSEQKVNWREYMFRHENHKKLTYDGFSICLRRTLQSMVVKTRPDDVEKDMELPPLSHKIVRLQPSFYDKLTANLFTLVLLANAITSEREDRDYIFHKDSAQARQQLIANLRQSAFFWTGFGREDVLASIKNSTGYLAKEGTGASPEDRQLLVETLTCTEDILSSTGWTSMSRSHELGVFVEGWPQASAEHWSFDENRSPLMTGISQLLDAQKFVNLRLAHDDPGDGLAGAGIKAMVPVKQTQAIDQPIKQSPRVQSDSDLVQDQVSKTSTAVAIEAETKQEISHKTRKREKKRSRTVRPPQVEQSKHTVLNRAGIPMSSLHGEPSLRRRASFAQSLSPRKTAKRATKDADEGKINRKRRRVHDDSLELEDRAAEARSHRAVQLSDESPYARAAVVGTTSAKMSYLVSQILKVYKHEKILVFYQGDNIAYYIAQVLELFHIRHEIYAKNLSPHLKASYVVRFDQEPEDRVLLMDVSQAAFGLNLSSASRIFFVNPVCRPDIEAQAIKRAHRIGQNRPVFVETLVLHGSIEEKMLERSQRMTKTEHLNAKTLEDDGGIREIIQSARLIKVQDEERSGLRQIAPLETGERLWARPGWDDSITPGSLPGDATYHGQIRVAFEDVTDLDAPERVIVDDTVHHALDVVGRFHSCPSRSPKFEDEESDTEPLLEKWSRRISLTSPAPNTLTLPTMIQRDDVLTTVRNDSALVPSVS